MGVFDLRCAVSRISTMWHPAHARRVTCSMFLVEHTKDRQIVPWTPPIRGTYDRYGGIELWPEDRSPYTDWVGERLWSLFESGALATSWPDDIRDHHDPSRSEVEVILHHGAETAYNKVKLTIDGRKVEACIVHDLVAEAIAAADPSPPSTLEAAIAAWFPEGGAGRRYFSDPPPEAFPQLSRYAGVLAYTRTRGGLRPIRSGDTGQHDDAFVRRTVRAARERDDGPLRALLTPPRVAAAEAAEAAARGVYEIAVRYADPRPYTPGERFAVHEVIAHTKFGLGLVEATIEPNKIRVRFGDDIRVLVHRPL
ncbi:MAG TPA: hypothetical protein VIK91_09305 [Nannocystis sp.]